MAAIPPAVTALRSNRAVVYSVIAAAITVAACAIVAVAWMLGWLPRPTTAAPAAAASPAQPAAGNLSADALDPGETIVMPADIATRPEPLMPTYSRPTPPAPAPAGDPEIPPVRSAARTSPGAERPRITNPDALPTSPVEPPSAARHEPYVNPDPSRPGPSMPGFARSRERDAREWQAAQAPRSRAGGPCEDCGRVYSITSREAGLWDVRVRLEDGGSRTFRFRDVPPLHIGDRVRVDRGYLLRE